MASINILPNVSQGLTDARKYIDGFNSTIVTPANARGISGFEFDLPSGENVTLTSDITDHYTENNSFINDHIVNKPVKITLRGFVGELVYKKAGGLAGIIRDLNVKLSQVTGYLGSYTPGFVQQIGTVVTKADVVINTIDQKIQQSQNVVGYLSGNVNPEGKQVKAFKKLSTLRNNKTIVTVQTPWQYYPSMVIESISFDQDEKSNDISDLSITLKEFRSSDLTFTSFNQALFKQPNEVQSATPTDNGPVKGKEELVSTLYKTPNAIGKLLGGQ